MSAQKPNSESSESSESDYDPKLEKGYVGEEEAKSKDESGIRKKGDEIKKAPKPTRKDLESESYDIYQATQAKDETSVDSEPEAPKEIPNPLHDQCFEQLLSYQEKNRDFVFWLRQKNTNNRLNEGYWFQGTENYAFVGLYNAPSGNYSTKSVGLVFWPSDDKGTIGLTFEVLHKGEKDKKRLAFYQWVRHLMEKAFEKTFEDHGEERFKVLLATSDPYGAAFDFLDQYKKQLDGRLLELGLDDMLINQEDFERRLSKTLERKEAVLKSSLEGFEDAEVDEAEIEEEQKKDQEIISYNFSRYKHISASEMVPVIGVVELAQEMSAFLTQLIAEAPMLVGLFGKWGRGKTFLFDQIWKVPETSKHFYRVDFHAWKHQETPASWGYMYEAIAKKYYDQSNSWFGRKRRAIHLNFKRHNNWELYAFLFLFLGGVLAIVFHSKLCLTSEMIPGALGAFAAIASIPAISKLLKLWEANSSKAKELYRKYSDRHSYTELLGVQAEVQSELKTLLTTWIPENKFKNGQSTGKSKVNKRVLLFVDDIDRCSEDRIIQVVDALRIMLEDSEIAKRVVVVAAIDERILRRAIRIKYENLLPERGTPDREIKLDALTREYLDKLFLSGIKLGNLNSKERIAIFSSLTNGKVEKIEETTTESVATSASSAPSVVANRLVDSEVEKSSGSSDSNKTLAFVPLNDRTEKKEDFEISRLEESILSSEIAELTNITPRQIRIFYLRYLLGRDFLKNLKNQSSWEENEINILAKIMAFLYNKNIMDQSILKLIDDDLNNSERLNFWRDLEEGKKDKFIEVLDMVVPY